MPGGELPLVASASSVVGGNGFSTTAIWCGPSCVSGHIGMQCKTARLQFGCGETSRVHEGQLLSCTHYYIDCSFKLQVLPADVFVVSSCPVCTHEGGMLKRGEILDEREGYIYIYI